MYATEDGLPPLARSASRWRVSLPLSIIALGLGYLLLIVVPLSPGLSALLPSQGALAQGASQLPTAASIAIAAVGGVALALVLARLVRGVERQPYASIAPVLAVLFGLLHLSLRIELPLAGFPSAHVSGFVIALALLGGALVARASGSARLLGWTLVIVPSALVFAVVTTAQGQGAPASLSALNSPVRVSLGLLAGSALLLGLAGVFARWLLRNWGRSELADSWADWSSVPLPSPAAQVPETSSWGGQFAPAAGAEGAAGLHGTLLGWGAQPGQADAQGATYGTATENGYAYPQASTYGDGYGGTNEAGYAHAQASDGYGAPQGQAYGGQSSYDGAHAGYGYGLQTQASEYQGGQAYGYGGAAAGYGQGGAGTYGQEGGYQHQPGPSTYEPPSAGYGGNTGASYAGADANYGNANYGNTNYGSSGASYGNGGSGYNQAGPGYDAGNYGGAGAGYGNASSSYGGYASAPSYAAPAAPQGAYTNAPAAVAPASQRQPAQMARPRGRTPSARAFARFIPLGAAAIAAAVGTYYLVHGIKTHTEQAASADGAPPPGTPVVQQLSDPLPAAAAPEPAPKHGRRHRHEHHEHGRSAREAKSADVQASKAATHDVKASSRGAAESHKGRGRAEAAPAQAQGTGMPAWGGSSAGRASTSSPSSSARPTGAGNASAAARGWGPMHTSSAQAASSSSTTNANASARPATGRIGSGASAWGPMHASPAPEPSAPSSTSARSANNALQTPSSATSSRFGASSSGSSAASARTEPPARTSLGRPAEKPAAAPEPPPPAKPAKPLTMDQLLDRVAPAKKSNAPKSQADRELDEMLEQAVKGGKKK